MVRSYRLTFTLRSASGSAWHADTIFGHLCWLMVWRHGPEKLQAWLERYQAGDPPLLLSDGFPGELLPRPLLLPPIEACTLTKQKGVRNAEDRKRLKKIEWLSRGEFDRVRTGETFQLRGEGQEQVAGQRVNFKNQINRLTGTTGAEGQLYPFVEYLWPTVTVYLRVADDEVKMVRQLFEDMAATGFGKRKSVGYGEIIGVEWQEFEGFESIAGANAFVSLSHFVPARDDPTQGQWKINVKYGKLGGEWAASSNPFKRPLMMLAAGSWFRTAEPDRLWYGRMVKGISSGHPEVVQYGLAFAVPIRSPLTTDRGGN